MRRAAVLSVVLALFLTASALGAATPLVAATCESDVTLDSGAVVRVCMPTTMAWNGDVVLWAHGYVETTRPVAIPEEQLCLGGTFCLPDVITALGYAFVTTSYRNNGLVLDGVEDMTQALDYFTGEHGAARHTYLTGASEGGLVTTLAVEQHPEVFEGGVAACGPIGDFVKQVGYYGDFRVLFDYFFPNLLPGEVGSIPQEAIDTWDSLWNDTLVPAIFAPENADKLSQLLKTARATYMRNDPTTIQTTVHDALWYNVFATNDLVAKLGGMPFDNMAKQYMGSADDAALNETVKRYNSDPAALDAVNAMLQTSGNLTTPLVTLHTWMDQQVSYSQEILYTMKLRDAGTTAERVNIPALRYGHCNFMPWEALLSFAIMVARVQGMPPANAQALLPDASSRSAYLDGLSRLGIATPAPSAAPAPRGTTTPTPGPAPAPKLTLAPE
jgi:pimeloyl-ACP methyl ester carboxylesterase